MSSGPGGDRPADIAGGARLTEEEQKQVARLLSDPTYFPIEFRTWIKQFIEGSDIRISAGQIEGGAGSNVATGLPAGIILAVASNQAIPADCLPCDGAPKLRSDFATLFGIIATTWGVGDGVTTFNVPDLRDRAIWGVGSVVGLAATDLRALGQRGGPSHYHGFSQTTGDAGAHSHPVTGSTDTAPNHDHAPPGGSFLVGSLIQTVPAGGSTFYSPQNVHGRTAGGGQHSHGISGSAGSAGSHSHSVSGNTSGGFGQDRPSYAGAIYVITTGAS
jgi:microcystin-dependent protein